MDGVLHFQGSCWPFSYSPCMRRFLKRMLPMWAWPLSWWWTECWTSKALADLFTILRACAGFWRECGQCEPRLELAMDGVLHSQSFCWPFYNSLRMRRFLKRRWPMWAWPLSWWWMECCISRALVDLFATLHACAGFWREGGQCESGLWADDWLCCRFQGSCWPFYYSPRMRRFLKRRWSTWAWPLSWWWMECCTFIALVDLFTTLHACAGFWREGGQCEPRLWADDGWSVAFPKLLLTFLQLSAHAQVFEEKVANVSLAFELKMDGVLHFQGSCRFFATLHACAGFWREGSQCEPGLWADDWLCCRSKAIVDLFTTLLVCAGFWIEGGQREPGLWADDWLSCFSMALVGLFSTLRACAGFWREGGQCEPGLWADDGRRAAAAQGEARGHRQPGSEVHPQVENKYFFAINIGWDNFSPWFGHCFPPKQSLNDLFPDYGFLCLSKVFFWNIVPIFSFIYLGLALKTLRWPVLL